MRKMYDAVTPANIPGDAQLVAGYLNGPYAWSAAQWALFPNAVHVGISVRASFLDGHVLDIEPGDATPAQGVVWVQQRRAAGADPTIYCNASTWPTVRAAFTSARVAEPHYWIAKYDGNPAIPAGAVAKQHTNTAGWDLSSVADYWPGVDQQPATVKEEDDMATAPAGQNEHIDIVVKGKSALYLACSYGEIIEVLQADFWGDTPSNQAGGFGVGGKFGPATIDQNRPGPIPIPPGAAMLSLRYTAKHSFGIGVV